MKFKIVSFKDQVPELEVFKKFMEWQNIPYKLIIDFGLVMETTKGFPCILVYLDESLIAIGFFEFLDYIYKKGLKLI